MKTLEQIAQEYKDNTLDGRQTNRLSQFIPFNQLKDFGITPKEEYNSEEKWNESIIPFTKENVLKQLKEDMVSENPSLLAKWLPSTKRHTNRDLQAIKLMKELEIDFVKVEVTE